MPNGIDKEKGALEDMLEIFGRDIKKRKLSKAEFDAVLHAVVTGPTDMSRRRMKRVIRRAISKVQK